MTSSDPRIFFVGTGGQGTLTATRLLAQAALCAGLEAVAGEVHGMAQRGGVVESTLLIGGWRGARLDLGEADILLGFEMLETLRALPWLKNGGTVFSSTEEIPPLPVALGHEEYPSRDEIETELRVRAEKCVFVPCPELGRQAGAVKSANTALLGAICSSGLLPFGLDALKEAIEITLQPKLQTVNEAAMRLGAAWYAEHSA